MTDAIKIVKLEVSNSRNDEIYIEWFFYESDEAHKAWLAAKKKQEKDWINDPCAVSMRWYSYTDYTFPDLLEYPIDELEGMKLKHVIELVEFKLKSA